jgi:hypothetical protein
MSHRYHEAEQLAAALDAAPDYAARLALLNAAPREMYEQLSVLLVGRKFMADTDIEAAVAAVLTDLSTFSQQLDAARDDDARKAIMEAVAADPDHGPVFISEWDWRRHATTVDWLNRFTPLLREAAL